MRRCDVLEKKDVTILVNSCDKYEDAWEPFFNLLKLQWYDCSYDIVLSTETKSYFCDYLNVKVINSPKDLPWSNRLKYTLSQIDTEYVLFFLEDFFLLEKVDVCCFEKALKIMNENKKISLIQFPSVEPHYKPPEIISDNTFVNVKLFKSYRAKVMVSLWRKKDFEKVIFDNENPWVCEKETSIRTITCGQKILRQDNNISVPTFYYCINPRMGYGITNGKWLKNNKSFFESYGIHNVNYEFILSLLLLLYIVLFYTNSFACRCIEINMR